MRAHTPGPWTAPEVGGRRYVVKANDGFIARCRSSLRGFQRPEAECEANARLIAAAPELLQLAKDDYLLGFFSCPHEELCGKCDYCIRRSLLKRIDPKWLAEIEGRIMNQPRTKQKTVNLCSVPDCDDEAIAEANARLIAAAPELLRLLKSGGRQAK